MSSDLNDYFLTVFVEQYDRCEDNEQRSNLLSNLETPATFKDWVIDNMDSYFHELNQAPAFLSAILGSVDYDTVRNSILDYDSGNFETNLECFDCCVPAENLREFINMETSKLLCGECEDKHKQSEYATKRVEIVEEINTN